MFPDDSEESSKHRCCTEFGRAKMQSFSQLTGWSKNCLASCCDHWQDHLYSSMALDVLQKWLQNHILEKVPRPEEPGTYRCSSESVWFPSEEIVVFECFWDVRNIDRSAVFVRWAEKPPSGKMFFVGDLMFTKDARKGSWNLKMSPSQWKHVWSIRSWVPTFNLFSCFGSGSQVFFRHALMRLVFLPYSELL